MEGCGESFIFERKKGSGRVECHFFSIRGIKSTYSMQQVAVNTEFHKCTIL